MHSAAHTLAEVPCQTMAADTLAERQAATTSLAAALDILSTHIRRRLTTITRQAAIRHAPGEIAAAATTTTRLRLRRDARGEAPSPPALAPREPWVQATRLGIAAGTSHIS